MANGENNEWKVWAIIIGSALLIFIIAILSQFFKIVGVVGILVSILFFYRAYEEQDDDIGFQGLFILAISFILLLFGSLVYGFLESSGALQYMKDIFGMFR